MHVYMLHLKANCFKSYSHNLNHLNYMYLRSFIFFLQHDFIDQQNDITVSFHLFDRDLLFDLRTRSMVTADVSTL